MMSADIDPEYEILLCDVLPIKEIMEVDHGFPGKVNVPHRAGRRLSFLTTGNRKIVTSPVGVVQQTL